jgi:hypothetical protein
VHADNSEGALAQPKECVQAHPYKHEIHERQLQGSYVDHVQALVYKLLPKEKQFILDKETVNLCLELKQLETPFNAFAEYLSTLSQEWINNPRAHVRSRLQALKEATPALVATRKAQDDKEKELRQQLQDMERNKVKGDLLDEKIKLARQAIGQ